MKKMKAKKSKSRSYAIRFAIVGAIVKGIQHVRQHRREATPGTPMDYGGLLKEMGVGALAGGGIGYIGGSIRDYFNDREKSLDTDSILIMKADKLQLKLSDPVYLFLLGKAQHLMQWASKEYDGHMTAHPVLYGSTQNGTAIRGQFDIDISLLFRSESFYSIGSMFDDLYNNVEKQWQRFGIVRVRKQDKSVGVAFNYMGKLLWIDLVPVRVTNPFVSATKGYLALNDTGLFSQPSRKLTDIAAINSLRFSDTQKKLFLLLKNWKKRNELSISSCLLQHILLDAYLSNAGRMPHRFTDKLLLLVKHILDHIGSAKYYGIENTNNLLSDITCLDKVAIRTACNLILNDFAYQQNTIVKHF